MLMIPDWRWLIKISKYCALHFESSQTACVHRSLFDCVLSPAYTEEQIHLTNMNNGHAHHIMLEKVVCFIKEPGDKLKCCYKWYLKTSSATHNMGANTQLNNNG